MMWNRRLESQNAEISRKRAHYNKQIDSWSPESKNLSEVSEHLDISLRTDDQNLCWWYGKWEAISKNDVYCLCAFNIHPLDSHFELWRRESGLGLHADATSSFFLLFLIELFLRFFQFIYINCFCFLRSVPLRNWKGKKQLFFQTRQFSRLKSSTQEFIFGPIIFFNPDRK